MFTLPISTEVSTEAQGIHTDEIDYTIFFVPVLLVQIKGLPDLLASYQKGLFPYKKELALLKIAQLNRRNYHASITSSDFVRSFTQPMHLLDKGALPFLEELEACILSIYHYRCAPRKTFDSTKYRSTIIDLAQKILEKKDWPPDFFS